MSRHCRRVFMARGAVVLLAGRFSQAAEPQGSRVHRIGFLANTPSVSDLVHRRSSNPAPRLFEDGLRDLGWIDGRNIQIVWRSAEGRYERLGSLVDEMIHIRVHVK